jgi:hypothetical protein
MLLSMLLLLSLAAAAAAAGKGARKGDAHAVQVVGYDNNRQAWLIKNSWGLGFGVNGFAWVGFDAPSMCDEKNTYGFAFFPSQPQPADLLQLTPAVSSAAGRKDCYTYKAVAGDYPEGLASRLDMPLQQLLLDNLDVIKDPSTLSAGTTLLLCNISSAVAAGGLPSGVSVAPSNVSASLDEVAALLAIKRALDPPGTALTDWQPGSANPCNWTGVYCDQGSQRVTDINFWDAAANGAKVQLSGQLPSGALLRRLPKLVLIGLHATGVSGPLPEDWSLLTQLEELYLTNNKLTGGCRVDTLMPYGMMACALWVARHDVQYSSTPHALMLSVSIGCWRPCQDCPSMALRWQLLINPVLCRAVLCSVPPLPFHHPPPYTPPHPPPPWPCCWTGPLPPAWSALSKLRVCNIWRNTLTGPLPGNWSRMAALEELDVSGNNLTGGWGR